MRRDALLDRRCTACRGAACCAPTSKMAGFTLIEVVVALTIGALVVLVAHQLFAAVAERGRTLIAARTALDRAVNARRWLGDTFLSLDDGTEGAGCFGGLADLLGLTSRTATPVS